MYLQLLTKKWAHLLLGLYAVDMVLSSCPSDFPQDYFGHCYYVSNDTKTAQEARSYCEEKGGDLAKIHDMTGQSVLDDFTQLLRYYLENYVEVYIGLYSFNSTNRKFVWLVDDESLTWSEFEPFINSSNFYNRDCPLSYVYIEEEIGVIRCLSDFPGTPKHFVCEEVHALSAPPNLNATSEIPTTAAESTILSTSASFLTTTSAHPTTTSTLRTTTSALPTTTSAHPTTTIAPPTATSALSTKTIAQPTMTSTLRTTTRALRTTTSALPTTTSALPTTTSALPTTTSAYTTTEEAAPAKPSTTSSCVLYKSIMEYFDEDKVKIHINLQKNVTVDNQVKCFTACSNCKNCTNILILHQTACWLFSDLDLEEIRMNQGEPGVLYTQKRSCSACGS